MTSSADDPQPRSMDEIEHLATAYARRRDALRETVDEAQAARRPNRRRRDGHTLSAVRTSTGGAEAAIRSAQHRPGPPPSNSAKRWRR